MIDNEIQNSFLEAILNFTVTKRYLPIFLFYSIKVYAIHGYANKMITVDNLNI